MKKISLLVIFLYIVFGAVCQPQQKDIVLSKKVQKINKQKDVINSIRVYHKPENLPVAIKAYEDLFAMDPPLSVCGPFYRGYADVLAQSGNLTKAITYYDLAINNGFAEPDEFGYTYRKEYFAKDTALYNRKRKEYLSMCVHSVRESQLIYELRQLLGADQFARKYELKHPECTDILRFSDSLIMKRLVDLMKEYPEYENIFSVDKEVSIVISRHLFSAYPLFWLTYFEPYTRKLVEEGICMPFVYADLYDKCIIRAYGCQSYYGQWDNNGKNANPDTELVNKRRRWLGLPPLQELKKDEFMIMPAYD